MALYEERLFRPVLWLALLTIAMFSSGCLTTTETSLFATSGPGWHVQSGQALWRPPGRGMPVLPSPRAMQALADKAPWRPDREMPELGGDLVMVSHEDGRCAIEFAKTPMSLVSAQTTRTNWLIQFPAGRMSFTGRGPGPTRFAWLYLHTALAGEPLPPPLRFERKPDGGWRLENTHTGETLEGFLAP
jgi:hypothetical protein